MVLPSFDDLKSKTEKADTFLRWLVELLRSRNWVSILLLIDVLFASTFNPSVFGSFLKFLSIELPGRYTPFFWLAVVVIFVGALVVAAWKIPRMDTSRISNLGRRTPIKGLRPFGFEDAQLFVLLQREANLVECVESI